MRRRTRNLLIGTGLLATLALLCTAAYLHLGNAHAVDATTHDDFNSTAADAREEGTFIQHVEIAPDTLRTPWGVTLRFGHAWIHEDSHLGYRWLVRRRLVREGTYRLCFNLKEDEPAQGMSLHAPGLAPARVLVDRVSGHVYEASYSFAGPWRFCRPVARPFPARIAVALVHEDTLRARMQRFTGRTDPPAPAGTRHVSTAIVEAGARTLRLTHTRWNGLRMLWISERVGGDGADARWRVLRVVEYPVAPHGYGLRFGRCGHPGGSPVATLVLERLREPVDINSAWRVDAAAAELVPIPVQDLTCGATRGF